MIVFNGKELDGLFLLIIVDHSGKLRCGGSPVIPSKQCDAPFENDWIHPRNLRFILREFAEVIGSNRHRSRKEQRGD